MADNNAHPGVRSLLAKFENSPSSVTSPPSRGRSPDTSDTPGSTRQLSRVRASFVTVDGVVQSNPGSPLRKTSGRSDSPGIFGPKINEQEVESRRQNVASPTPAGLNDSQEGVLDQMIKPAQPETTSPTAPKDSDKQEPKVTVDDSPPAKETPPAPRAKMDTAMEPVPAPKDGPSGPPAVSEKPATKTVTKRPSIINTAKAGPAHKSPSTATSTAAKQPATTTTRSARETAKERAGTLASKPSRASLNPSTKSAPRTTRGSTPAQESSKVSPPNSAKSRPRSPTRPVRLPPSMTAQTQSSSAKTGTAAPSNGRASTTASTLTRKPSSLKSAAGAGQPRSTGTAAGLRRQSSRPSLPAQQAQERPSSRTSDVGASTKPVNEGFLARMMRPTASSASKTHERSDGKPSQKDTKPAQKPAATSKTARPSIGRAPERSAPPKAKSAPLRSHGEKSHSSNKGPISNKDGKEVKVAQTEQESEKENIEESTPVIPEEPEFETLAKPVADTSSEKLEDTINHDVASEQVKPTTVEASAEVQVEAPVDPVEPAKPAAEEDAPAVPLPTETLPSAEPSSEGPVEREEEEAPPAASPVPDIEETETFTDGNGAQELDIQTESPEEVYQTPADLTDDNDALVVSGTENPSAEDGVVSQAYEAPSDQGAEKITEPTKDSVTPDVPTESAEGKLAKESNPAPQPSNETGKKVDEIDFVSLALN